MKVAVHFLMDIGNGKITSAVNRKTIHEHLNGSRKFQTVKRAALGLKRKIFLVNRIHTDHIAVLIFVLHVFCELERFFALGYGEEDNAQMLYGNFARLFKLED